MDNARVQYPSLARKHRKQPQTGQSSTPIPPAPTPSSAALATPAFLSQQNNRISTLLAVIQDQQATILAQNAISDRSLRDLLAQIANLNERLTQNDHLSKERESNDKAKEEREKQHLKALTLLAQRVDDVRKRVVGIESVVGVSTAQNHTTTVLGRLHNIQMDVDEWLERLRDPDAGSIQPLTPSSLSPTVPRHEIAGSPIRPSSSNQAVSRTPDSLPSKIDVSTQVDPSDNQPTTSTTLCGSCSTRLRSPLRKFFIALDSTNTSAPSQPKGKQVDNTPMQGVIDDDPLVTTQSDDTPTTPCKHPDRIPDTPDKLPIGSFSPVDWTKTPGVKPSPPSVPSPTPNTANNNKSYTIPPHPEGTVAALRKQVLVDPYPYPLESTGLSDGNPLVANIPGVMGASLEAAERMPSPESQYGDDDDDTIVPKVCDTQLQEESGSIMSSLTSLSESNTPRASLPEQTCSTPVMPVHPASQTTNITEDEDAVMTLVMDSHPTASPALLPQSISSPILRAASTLVLVSPEPNNNQTRLVDNNISEGEEREDKQGLIKWYKEQRMKALDKNTTEEEGVPDAVPSPLFTSSDVSPLEAEAKRRLETDDGGLVSPLFTPPGVTPRQTKKVEENEGGPRGVPTYLKKLVDLVNDDDDADIIPLKRKRISSTSVGPVHEEKAIGGPKPLKKGLKLKKVLSKAKTRIKKRKISPEEGSVVKIEINTDDDDDDEPPLKRVQLRLNNKAAAAATTTNNTVGKPKSVSVLEPVKTPMKRRVRDPKARSASVVWPKMDKPVFDQFIECDICERWYHVGCVGIHPDDIRLSASEIYRCPPCDAGISKEGKFVFDHNRPKHLLMRQRTSAPLTPNQTIRGDTQDEACARPRCLCPRRIGSGRSVKKEATFIVESFVGMVKKSVGGRGIKLVYLVKWLGYGFEDATWEEETAMGLPNPGFFAERFEEEARKEGIDLGACDNSRAALLGCAVEAGWKSNGLFVKAEERD